MSDLPDSNEASKDPQLEADDILRAKVSTRVYLEGGGDLYIEVYSNDTERSIASMFQGLEFLQVYKSFSMTPLRPPVPQTQQQVTQVSPTSATPMPVYTEPTTVAAAPVATPQAAPQTGVDEEVYQVASVAFEKIVPSKGGEAISYVRVKTVTGTKFSQYGIRAWPEVIPEDVRGLFESWKYGVPSLPPPSMANIATVDGKRVSRFFPNS